MNRNEEKVFFDEYIDGRKEYYTVTFGELVDALGYNEAAEVWETGEEKNEKYRF